MSRDLDEPVYGWVCRDGPWLTITSDRFIGLALFGGAILQDGSRACFARYWDRLGDPISDAQFLPNRWMTALE